MRAHSSSDTRRRWGSDVVDELFARVPRADMATTFVGFAEVVSVLVRKRNDGRADGVAFAYGLRELEDDVIFGSEMT